MKVQIHKMELEPDSMYEIGSILVKGRLRVPGGKKYNPYDSDFIITLQFHNSQDLLSLDGNDKIVVEYQDPWDNWIKLDAIEQTAHEEFRRLLGSFNTLCLQRLRKACGALIDSLKLEGRWI